MAESAGLRYQGGGYFISGANSSKDTLTNVEGRIAAYGPWFENFRASVSVEEHGGERTAGGLIFRLNESGYYVVLLRTARPMAYKLVKRFWSLPAEEVIPPWTPFQHSMEKGIRIGVECIKDRIAVRLDGIEVLGGKDDSFRDGQVGMAAFGPGNAVFRDLQVESIK